MLRVLDLFGGIGGFSLGLERTGGFQTVAFCEIDPFCRRVLAKHWPDVPCYEDVRTLTADALARDGIAVDVICGGFPCQDVSLAGNRSGLAGARSGLWGEYARLIRELRPRFVVVENVPGLLSLGMGDVLGDLAACGYDAEWDCIPASAVGAAHRRDRVWIVAHTASLLGTEIVGREPNRDHARAGAMANATGDRRNARRARDAAQESRGRKSGRSGERSLVANTDGARLEERQGRAGDHGSPGQPKERAPAERSGDVADAIGERQLQSEGSERELWRRPSDGGWWRIEPDVGRVAHGVPSRVDRLRSLGNAVVPQIPELIGRAILSTLPHQEIARG